MRLHAPAGLKAGGGGNRMEGRWAAAWDQPSHLGSRARIDRLMAEKYRVRRVLIMPIYRLVKKLRGTPIDAHGGAYLAISSA